MPKYHINLRVIDTEHTRLHTIQAGDPGAAMAQAINESREWGYAVHELEVVNLFLIDEPEPPAWPARITEAQATSQLLDLLNTPLVPNDGDRLRRIDAVHDMLSSGEKAIARLAQETWGLRSPLCDMDEDSRRKALRILIDFYVGEGATV